MTVNTNKYKGFYEFNGFRFDADRRVLWRDGEIVNLPPKALDVLFVLVENSGEVVAKPELIEAVWADSFVEESNLTHQIYELRKAFKECVNADLIQTVSRRGYRFIGEIEQGIVQEEIVVERSRISRVLVEQLIDTDPSEAIIAAPANIVQHSPLAIHQLPGNTGNRKRIILAALFALIVLAVGVGIWQWLQTKNSRSLAEIRSIAVLPLNSFNGAEDDALQMRITDALITKLGKIESLSVRPTSSVSKFTGTDLSPVDIGKMLEVDAVLDGRIQSEGNKIRVTLQLISVKTGEQIWSDQFDGETGRLLDMQDAVASRFVKGFNLQAANSVTNGRLTASDAAYEEYLKGRYFWNKRTRESLASAISSFQNAVKLDANFAEAYVGLADSYFLLVDYSYDLSAENVIQARKNVLKAIELSPDLAEAWVTLGLIQMSHDWDWPAAETSLKKAIDIDPDLANAHHRYAMLILKMCRYAEAETAMRRAKSLDPLSPGINMNLGVVLYFSKQYDAAIEQFQKTLELDAAFTSPYWYLARCYWMNGDEVAAWEIYVKALRQTGGEKIADQIEKDLPTAAKADVLKRWEAAWESEMPANGISHHDLAVLSAFRQDSEKTLFWLEKGLESRHPWMTWIAAEPEFDFIRSEPRFQAMLKKINLQ